MNWYRPFADEVDACADGLMLDSIFAVVSRYSKLIPLDLAAWRIAPVICGAALVAAGLTAMVLPLCEALGSWSVTRMQRLSPACRAGGIMVNEW